MSCLSIQWSQPQGIPAPALPPTTAPQRPLWTITPVGSSWTQPPRWPTPYSVSRYGLRYRAVIIRVPQTAVRPMSRRGIDVRGNDFHFRQAVDLLVAVHVAEVRVDDVAIGIDRPQVAGHPLVPVGGRLHAEVVARADFVPELPGEHGRRVGPPRDDVAQALAEEVVGFRIDEEIGRRGDRPAVGRVVGEPRPPLIAPQILLGLQAAHHADAQAVAPG